MIRIAILSSSRGLLGLAGIASLALAALGCSPDPGGCAGLEEGGIYDFELLERFPADREDVSKVERDLPSCGTNLDFWVGDKLQITVLFQTGGRRMCKTSFVRIDAPLRMRQIHDGGEGLLPGIRLSQGGEIFLLARPRRGERDGCTGGWMVGATRTGDAEVTVIRQFAPDDAPECDALLAGVDLLLGTCADRFEARMSRVQ